MSVLTPVIDSIDGTLRRIYLKADVSDFYPIEDIYHEYRNRRRVDEELRKYNPLLQASGNIPKGGGAFTPRYVVLLEGTKIVPFNNTTQLNQLGDMITDDPDTDPTLYDTTTVTVPKVIYIKPSEAETIQLNSEAIVYSSFQNAVWVDANSIYDDSGSGSEPNGNRERPVNNIQLAVQIAQTRGFNTLSLLSDVTLGTGDSLEGFVIEGQNSTLTHLVILDAAETYQCEIRNCHVTGILDGQSVLSNCEISELNYVNGSIHHSMFNGKLTLGGAAAANIHGCYSGVPGLSTPEIDMGGSGQSLGLRDYSGGILITNKTGPEPVSLDINTGQVILDSTVTNGTIVIRGNVKVTDNSTGDTVVEMDSVVLPETAYDGEVTMAPQTGFAGQEYPVGTKTRPVASNDDAVAIATRYNLTSFSIKGTLIADRSFPNASVRGDGAIQSNIFLPSGYDFEGCVFKRLTIVGLITGANTQFEEVIFSNASGVQGLLQDCVIFDNLTLGGDVISRGLTLANSPSVLDFGVGTDYSFKTDVDSGTLQINNLGVDNYCQLSFGSGSLTIDSSCVGGIIQIRGNVDITDNSGGAVTILDKSLGTNVAMDVWDEVLTGATHNIPASAGRRLRNVTSTIVLDGITVSSTANTITLNGDASDVDGAYDPGIIAIVEGTGIGQARLILEYNGTTKTAVVDRNWKVLPDATSECVITSDAGREHINEGLAQGGGANTIILNSAASDEDNTYNGQTIFIRSGLGEDQAHKVIAYDGATHTATIYHNWNVIPDATSAYVMLPTGVLGLDVIENSVWDAPKADHLLSGSVGEAVQTVEWLLGNKVTRLGDVITIYEDDGLTIWKQIDLTNGGRVEV